MDANRLNVRFYRSAGGREPVREWLIELPRISRHAIGVDIKTVQLGWPLGMPLVRKLGRGLWEIRVSLAGSVARVLFTVLGDEMILLHGFIKKSRKTPTPDLELAIARRNEVVNG